MAGGFVIPEALVLLDGPWGRIALRPSCVSSLRGDMGRLDPITHVGLPSGEIPVRGRVEEIADRLGLLIAPEVDETPDLP